MHSRQSPSFSRNKSSFSNWIDELSFRDLAAYVLKPSGRGEEEYNTRVKLGSGDGPMFVNVL